MVRGGPAVPEAVWIQLTGALSYGLVGGHKMDQELTFIHSLVGTQRNVFLTLHPSAQYLTAGKDWGGTGMVTQGSREEFRE